MQYAIVISLLVVTQLFAAEFKKEGGDYVYRDTLRFEESALDLSKLDCEAVNGEIQLTGEDRNTVSVTAFVRIEAEDLKDGQAYLKGFKPVVERDGATLKVYTVHPDSKISWDDLNANIDFVIVAPKQLNLEASCANGEITAVGMTGGADLSSANGEISFVSLDGVHSSIDASCANGEITIDVAKLHGDSKFSTANGEISITVHKTLAGNISASTANGAIELALPENSSMKVSASTLVNGSISSDWSGNREESLIGDEYELVVNEGQYLVECSSVNGEISIRKANQAN